MMVRSPGSSTLAIHVLFLLSFDQDRFHMLMIGSPDGHHRVVIGFVIGDYREGCPGKVEADMGIYAEQRVRERRDLRVSGCLKGDVLRTRRLVAALPCIERVHVQSGERNNPAFCPARVDEVAILGVSHDSTRRPHMGSMEVPAFVAVCNETFGDVLHSSNKRTVFGHQAKMQHP